MRDLELFLSSGAVVALVWWELRTLEGRTEIAAADIELRCGRRKGAARRNSH